MAINKGKLFEAKLKEDFLKLEGISIDRLADQVSGKKGSKNICDFIIYRFPFICYCEAKCHKGNTFPLDKLTQYEKLLSKKGIKGVKAGAMIWFQDHHKVWWVPIETFELLKERGYKSVNARLMKPEDWNIFEVPSKLKRVFMDSDYFKLFELWESELI